jgi:hypothetical protein
MNPDLIFQIVSAIAMISWIILIIFPFKSWTSELLIGVIITLFGIVYTFIIFTNISPGDFNNFSTLDGVMALFANKEGVVAGWIHYLAFDLMAGLYIVNNSRKYQINRWILLPSLFFTFMLGPFGLLLYLIIRALKTRQYFHQY